MATPKATDFTFRKSKREEFLKLFNKMIETNNIHIGSSPDWHIDEEIPLIRLSIRESIIKQLTTEQIEQLKFFVE